MLYWKNPSSSQMNDPIGSLKRIVRQGNYRDLNTKIYWKVMDSWAAKTQKVVLIRRLISAKITKTVTNNAKKYLLFK